MDDREHEPNEGDYEDATQFAEEFTELDRAVAAAKIAEASVGGLIEPISRTASYDEIHNRMECGMDLSLEVYVPLGEATPVFADRLIAIMLRKFADELDDTTEGQPVVKASPVTAEEMEMGLHGIAEAIAKCSKVKAAPVTKPPTAEAIIPIDLTWRWLALGLALFVIMSLLVLPFFRD